ncbi:MAG: trigger factor [Alphaproteobacteria bacterium]
MQPTKEKIKGIKYELSFEIPTEEFETKLNEQLTEFAKTHKEKGFRPGHVPMEVIKQKYEGHFIGDVINTLINETLSNYCKEHKITPAIQPNVKVDSFVRNEPLKFSADFEILPIIKDIDFSKITLEKKVAHATDKEIDESIENIAKSRYTTESIKTERKTKSGDIAVIDFEGFEGGKPFEGGKGENYPLELGSNTFIPGFEDQVIGHSKGDSFDVNVEFPKDYGHDKLAGKPAVFKVKINDIKEKKIPEINDAFAVELKRKDLADLKSYVKELLEQNFETASKNMMKDELLEKLSDEKIELPESLINQEVEYMFHQFQHTTSEKLDEKAEKKKKDELKKQAESRVKLGLIIADIGKKEKIEITQNDIQQAIMAEAMKYPQQAGQIFEYYQKNQSAAEAIRANIFEEKVLDLLLSKVKTKEKEVPSTEFTKPKK